MCFADDNQILVTLIRDFKTRLLPKGNLNLDHHMICVLEVIEGPARGKRIWLKENMSIEVGRVSTADFAVPSDGHMSRRHLLLESTKGGFRVRDMGSANGTFLNDARITVENLSTGDTVRAGMTTFSVSIRDRGENPHSQDGLTFSHRLRSSDGLAPENHGTIRSLEGLEGLEGIEQSEFENTLRIPARSAEIPSEIKQLEPLLDSLPKVASWWKSYFKPISVSPIFEQSALYSSPFGNLMGLLKEFESEFELSIIVNESQLDSKGHDLLASLGSEGYVESLSKTLWRVKFGTSRDFQKILALYVGQDAIICLGEKKRLSGDDWGLLMNSFSYPSMLRTHLTSSESNLRKTLLRLNLMCIFELDSEGNLGLFNGE